MSRLLRPSRLRATVSSQFQFQFQFQSLSERTAHRQASSSFLRDQPSPPRLPADQQAEFERLQREAEAKLSSHNEIPSAQQQQQPLTPSSQPQPPSQAQAQRVPDEGGVSAGTLSGGIRQGAPPEFEGEKNPKTGEIGGPKNEPLRWGSGGDWSYNGRVTDF